MIVAISYGIQNEQLFWDESLSTKLKISNTFYIVVFEIVCRCSNLYEHSYIHLNLRFFEVHITGKELNIVVPVTKHTTKRPAFRSACYIYIRIHNSENNMNNDNNNDYDDDNKNI